MHSKNIMALQLNFRCFEILSGKAVKTLLPSDNTLAMNGVSSIDNISPAELYECLERLL